MSYDIDLIKRGVLATKWKNSVDAPVDTFLQDVLFGGSPIMGDGSRGLISYNFRRRSTAMSEEALFGADPNRVNFNSDFDWKVLKPAYFNDDVVVDWHTAENRVFQEGLTDPVDMQARMVLAIADQRDALISTHKMNIEKMCSDMLLNGKVTVKDGGVQAMPMTSSLLSVSGANLFSKPVDTIVGALTAMRKVNKAAKAAKAIILNMDDALNLTLSLGTLINKETFNLGSTLIQSFTEKGLMYMGRIVAGGYVEIYGYAGAYTNGSTTANYLPKGKALLITEDKLGAMGFGAVMNAESGYSVPTIAADRTLLYSTGVGDNKALHIQHQVAPLPIVTAIDSYCVITNIPADRATGV